MQACFLSRVAPCGAREVVIMATSSSDDPGRNGGLVYGPGPTKSTRRTRAEIEAIKTAICAVLREDPPMTVRQVFYQLVSNSIICKS
jgi:hypothetical protein